MAIKCFLLFSVLNKSEIMTDDDMSPPDYIVRTYETTEWRLHVFYCFLF